MERDELMKRASLPRATRDLDPDRRGWEKTGWEDHGTTAISREYSRDRSRWRTAGSTSRLPVEVLGFVVRQARTDLEWASMLA